MKNNGVKSEDAFVKRLEDAHGKGVYVERLPDTKSIKGVLKSGYIVARPSDFIVTLHGVMAYCEVKSCSDKTSFPFSNFEKAQWAAMKKQRAAGGNYFCYLHNLLTNTWYVVDGKEILRVEETGTKSIKWKDMNQWII